MYFLGRLLGQLENVNYVNIHTKHTLILFYLFIYCGKTITSFHLTLKENITKLHWQLEQQYS